MDILQRGEFQHIVSKHSTLTLHLQPLCIRYCGHLAGALTGLLLGLALLDNRKVEIWEKKLKKVSIALYFILLLIAVLWHIVSLPFRPTRPYKQ